MKQSPRQLLVIEDNESDYLIVSDLLNEMANVEVEVEWVRNYDAALQELRTGEYDVCLLDYGLGKKTGLELLHERGGVYGVPVIVLTGQEDYAVDAAMAQAGATDYLIKRGLSTAQLERSIRYALQRGASEKLLLQAKSLTQSIVDNLPQQIAVLDSQGGIVTVNSSWNGANKSCFPGAGGAIGANLIARYEQDGAKGMPFIAQGLRDIVAGTSSNPTYSTEFHCNCDQERHWFEIQATRLKGSDPPLAMVAFEEITARKAAETRLRVSEANLIQAQEMAAIGSWELDLTGNNREGNRFWTDETYRILGYRPGEVEPTYANFLRAIHPDDLETFTAQMEHYRTARAASVINHRLLRPDGSVRFVQERLAHILDPKGKAVKLIGTIQDVTGRSQEEARLRFQQTLLEAQSQASIDGMLVVSPEGNVLSYNRRFLEIWDLDESMMALSDNEILVSKIYEKLSYPEPFLAKVQYLYGRIEEKSHDEVVLTDGRTLDRYSAPVTGADGFFYGRVWYYRDITERKKAEADLATRNQEMLVIWESMTDAFFALDNEWRFTYLNSQAEITLQRSADSLFGKSVWEEFPESRDLAFYREYDRAIKEQIPVNFEEFFTPLNKWFEVHAYPSPMGLAVYYRDITQRKRVEQELRASEARFEGIVSNVPGMVYQFVAHEDGRFELPFISRGSIELLGLEPHELRTHPMRLDELTHPEDLPDLLRSIEKAIVSGEPWFWEGRKQLASGQIKWIRGVSHPREMPDGTTLWDGLLTDITQRKEAEEERDRFFTLSLDMLAIVGRDSRLKRFNSAFENTLGYSAEVLRATPLLDFVHPDDLADTMAHMASFNSGDTDVRFINRNICSDGSIKWLAWHAVLFENLFYVVAHDITPLVRAEGALRQSNEVLEQKVAERTRELATANEGLRVENLERQMSTGALREIAEAYRLAQEESEAANQAKSEFLSRMSHELRTPLNAILGFGEILQEGNLQSEEKEQVGQILHGGWHLLDLINEILDISRVESGDLDLSLEPVSVGEMVKESCALVSPLAAQRKVHLHTEPIEDSDLHVLADRQRLKQVLINLLSNAIKYNRENGQVTVSFGSPLEGRVRVAVQDTGQGLTPQELEKLFIPFERLGAADSAIEGTGLGLVLSKRLITAMGGSIQAVSTPGTGSTFSIEMAFADPAFVDPVQTPAGDSNSSSLQPADLPRETILPARSHLVLSVEDNALNQSLLQQILSRRPEFSLMSAATGEMGFNLALAHLPDLILLNLNLSDISGQEVLRRLRQEPVTRNVPVVVVSADASSGQAQRLLEAGATHYLTKPYSVAQLLQTMDRCLSPSSSETLQKVAIEPAPQPETSPTNSIRSLRVLVAEDNLVNQKLVCLQLGKLGHQTVVCENGEATIETWKEGGYDVILMDCHMPVKDGYAAARAIRNLEKDGRHIPIIALTANALAEDRDKSFEAGMDDHLSKPVKQKALEEALQRHCG